VLYASELRPVVDRAGGLSFACLPTAASTTITIRIGPDAPSATAYRAFPVDRTALLAKLLDRDIVFAVGTKDTTSEYLDQSRSANAQGPNRYTR